MRLRVTYWSPSNALVPSAMDGVPELDDPGLQNLRQTKQEIPTLFQLSYTVEHVAHALP
jgi:hypothetical protein